MQRQVLLERFFTALISGDRAQSRGIVDEVLAADVPAEAVIERLLWPTLEHVETLHRNDQLSDTAHHYATRLMRMFADQIQLRLEQKERRGKRVLLVCGPDEQTELQAQLAADCLEADGYDVYFVGGGIANDEIVAQLGELQAQVLCVFGGSASMVPFTRQLIDHIRETTVCPNVQIVVGGGIFNRAEGLAQEIGADLWARDPQGLIEEMAENPKRRMADDQRTVGRRRRVKAA